MNSGKKIKFREGKRRIKRRYRLWLKYTGSSRFLTEGFYFSIEHFLFYNPGSRDSVKSGKLKIRRCLSTCVEIVY